MANKTTKPTPTAAPAVKKKSWKRFLVMVIIGAVFATVAIVCYELWAAIDAQFKTLEELINAGWETTYWAYLGLTIAFGTVALGLLGPGVPLMIVGIIKEKKTKKAKVTKVEK